MQIFLTIVGGAATFVLGQIILRIVVEPVHSMKSVVAEISHKLMLHAKIYANPKPTGDESYDEVMDEFREISSKLLSAMYLVPRYELTALIFGLPSKENVIDASKNLIGLSNGHDHLLENQGFLNRYYSQHIRDSLGLYMRPEERLNPDLEEKLIKLKEQ